MDNNLSGFSVLIIIGMLAASETSTKAAPSGVDGASCAILPSEVEFGSWKHRSQTQTCLRDLAFENWTQARSEATHIATRGIANADLDELIVTLARYHSAAKVRTALQAYGLLNGKGRPWVLENNGEDWRPLTGSDWLIKAGNQFSFDAETGTHPNNHEDPYQLYATLDDRNWKRQAENYGDWYDVSEVLDLVNEMAADTGIPDRIMPLETGDQSVTVIVGPGRSLVSAANDGLIRPADATAGMSRGKAFEEEILRRYRIVPK